MSLAQRLASEFSPRIRERGRSYFSQGRVKILSASDTRLDCRVRGSEHYAVSLNWKKSVLDVYCDCLYFEGGELCKHLWAAILAADFGRHLSTAASDPALSLEFDDSDWNEDSEDSEEEDPIPPRLPLPRIDPPALPPKLPAWQKLIDTISGLRTPASASRLGWPSKRQIIYLVDAGSSQRSGSLVLAPCARDAWADGRWKPPTTLNITRGQIPLLASPEDREILSELAGPTPFYGWSYSESQERISEACLIPPPLERRLIAFAARTGRCYLQTGLRSAELSPIVWDEGGPWSVKMELRRHSSSEWEAAAFLRRDSSRLELNEVILVTPGGLAFTSHAALLLAENTPTQSVAALQNVGTIRASAKDLDKFLGTLLSAPGMPPIESPPEVQFEEVTPQPRFCLRIRAKPGMGSQKEKLHADLSFEYEGRQIGELDRTQGVYLAEERRFLRRNGEAEEGAIRLLRDLGVQYKPPEYWDPLPKWLVPHNKLPHVVRALVEVGWHIEAEGKVFRRPGGFHLEVSSGIDWFELHGNIDYGESVAKLPELLEALRQGESMVRLDDGTFGVLPEQWLRRIGMLAGMGTPENGHIRFRPAQVGLLDALLASQPEVCCDESFARARQELGQFRGIESAPQPGGFAGNLRDYQKEGLGWMHFLRRFSFGGCLADDMGVGKTAQVLALLEARRAERAASGSLPPSLVVVPRSLIFNWKQEAARFTPLLRVLDYTGTDRDSSALAEFDVVLTTYGTLRRDVVRLKDMEFDYVVLDEAQAIKNAGTEAAKAVRLLRGAHRLALSGTPVENHLGEIWSLFEFLNPGMLGRASVFKLAGGAARNPDEESRRLLAHSLRPFILRRTKAQVAPELPAKTEQTIFCEMESAQRKIYNELRQHYRDVLLKRVDETSLAKSKIQVLEALLRLRQAACHPGLIDKQRVDERSAKLDMLLDQLREVVAESHKSLVFSQFTSLLAIVRDRLDREGFSYEYLDGQTHDRQARVERFQNDPSCQVFLVSLKAGGLGLNLTAAEYVFLLDPWWNPAVEAQAIDRAHRIGQSQQVFAYRLIARDTVEEKVLELQKTKRDLADAIIGADNSLIRDLRREDLELLLS